MVTAAAEGGVTGVHDGDAWVDPILRADPSRGERTKLETLEWRLKALLPCLPLSPYFLFPESTHFFDYTISLFLVLFVWPSSIRGEPKIQAMPGLSLLRLSYTTFLEQKNQSITFNF